ncbi:hypothetical protein GPL15_06615 [Clostridium sp. MCC353]|nr:hypothetical protein [Clostridium sp. MCC353]
MGCEGKDCSKKVSATRGDEVYLKRDYNNLYDKNAIQVVNEKEVLLGYVPRYYCSAFVRMMEEEKNISCHIASVNINKCCDECIQIMIEAD